MSEAVDLQEYLPVSYKSNSEAEYMAFLWDAFDMNYAQDKFQFAFLAYHMLTMSFVYFNVWQIRQHRRDDFQKAMVGFNKDMEHELLAATSPFTYWRVNESSVMRFMKLIGCDNAKIGTYAKLVADRNETAHCNGNIFFNSKAALDSKISEILRIVDEIQTHSEPVIDDCYREFLLNSHDPEEREYADVEDQIREELIHVNYFSARDIEVCVQFDVESLKDEASFGSISELHREVCARYRVS